MKRFALTLALLLALAVSPALADHLYNGYVTSSGYAYRDGYFYYGNQAYTRSVSYAAGYWSCGIYYPGYQYYNYTPYYAPAAPYVPPAQPVVTPDNYREVLAKSAAETRKHGEFMEAMAKFGPPGGLPLQPGYGAYPYTLQGAIVSYPYNATTRFGYNALQYNPAAAQAYQDTSVTELFQMLAQLTQGSQVATDKALTGFSSLVKQESEQRLTFLKQQTNAALALEMLKTLQSGGEVKGISFKFEGGQLQKQGDFADPKDEAALTQQFNQIVGTKCASCHANQKVKGGIDLAKYLDFSPEQYDKVATAISWVSPNKELWMPRNPDGGLGNKLTPAEIRVFLMLAKGKGK